MPENNRSRSRQESKTWFGQQIEERSPEARVYSVQPTVEATFGDRLFYVSILIQKRAARLDVATEEGAGHKRYGHHLGGGRTDLWVVAVADDLQELVAQVVGGGYGIVQGVLPIREKVQWPSNREDIIYLPR